MKKGILIFIILYAFKAEAQSSASAIADSLYMTGNFIKSINKYVEVGDQQSNLQIARAYNAIGNYKKAIAQYESLVDGATAVQIARFELGKLYFKTKAYAKSQSIFTELIADTNNNAEYLYYQGESFRKLDQIDASVIAYKKAVAIDSTHLRSLFQLGKYFVIQQEKNQALLYIDKGLEFYEDDVALINLKALALFNNNEYEKATPLFERLVALGEQKKHIYTKLAHCYYKAWEFEKSKQTYRILLEMDDEDHDAYFNLGQVFYREKQIDSARYYVKKSIEVQEVFFDKEYRSLAEFARDQNDLKSAFEYYKLAHEENPVNFLVYYNICTLADQLYKDPKVKLHYYENFVEKFGGKTRYFPDVAAKRISELKEEIHFAKD